MARVELRNLTKSWDAATAVADMSLSIADGEFTAILGPSGCGKSTTLFMLAGVYRPTAGDIFFDGARVNDVEARSRNVGIVFQSYALYPNMSVLQNILFPLRFQKVPDADRRAREMAELVQVGELLDRRPSQLSGGQQQRVALARALVKRPNLLLLDEPLSNLDATLRLSMRAEIRRITRELGVTTILVTHDQIEATTMADRVVCMANGRVEQVGTADDLYLRPDTRFVAGFIGSPPMNLIEATVHEGAIRAGAARIAVTGAEGTVTLGLRPEMLHPAERGLQARVAHVEPMGRERMTTAYTDFGTIRFIEPIAAPARDEGELMHLQFDAADTILFGPDGRRLPGARASLPEAAHA
ncbi:ABC transporter ATP-binding protein [Psychromarinibacter sp. C21-152]|uniref:ABC transporter ATP-binding protein n=1 Tax=Psychromarinibacter sediminicola TaxID=3033385 RepID=A0AAE3TAQ5_9RHOB|nr:ABC transporter ATP-binding protein [Psychromarinibacter sediminicola]MDF0603098.1 ABC transporter ATP-binding protein [Psychromarinibacter sediminicola]